MLGVFCSENFIFNPATGSADYRLQGKAGTLRAYRSLVTRGIVGIDLG